MKVHLEKRDASINLSRFYALSVQRSLFGEWVLVRRWGRIGSRGGQTMSEYFDTEDETLDALARMRAGKERRGYDCVPW